MRLKVLQEGGGGITNNPFQSYLSAIKSIAAFKDEDLRQARFNPTLVRLKVFEISPHVPFEALFQSYLSAIKRQLSGGLYKVCIACFNPTLVRLKALNFEFHVRFRKLRFNPTLVRLKEVFLRDFSNRLLGFNPTLVRLKAPQGMTAPPGT